MSNPGHIKILADMAKVSLDGAIPTCPVSAKSVDKLANSKILGLEDAKLYNSLVGGLLFVCTISRPDFAFVCSRLSRYITCPTEECMHVVKRGISYLLRTADCGISFSKSNTSGLSLSADADWAGCKATRRSTTGYVISRHGIISFKSRLPLSVALSSAEAEVVALSLGCSELAFVERIISEIEGTLPRITIFEDNRACGSVANSPGSYTKLKHVETRHFFCQNYIQDRKDRVQLITVPTTEQLADVLTKPVEGREFSLKTGRLGMRSSSGSMMSSGGVS
eukprot:TRINITY_DN78_c0_g1_i1.p1 TRINITY_DN78_c0_g1~~TRINITY_DN78_c0_g1_i1.p1  ORF type:complete len:280 (+),score=46.21 TRINITY_DN78_c0_g1_i1:304-1143(+)